MKRQIRSYKTHRAPGTAPGTLHDVPDAPPPKITLIAYNEEKVEEAVIDAVTDIDAWLEKWPTTWINVDGIGSAATISALGEMLGLHPLALEDVTNLQHRPKTEDFSDYLFIIMRQALLKGDTLDLEQISMFVGKKFVLTFQEREGDCFDPVRARIRKGGKRIRGGGTDYLGYAIMDAVIDGYFPVLESYGDTLNDLEDEVIVEPGRNFLEKTHDIKRDMRALRQAIWPMRETVNGFAGENTIVDDETRPYLRDCYDHIIQVFDILETYRERTGGLTDIYLSSVSNRMNEVMKVLTIIATIFIPLGFIAGLYGMNFDSSISPWNMPELHWAYGYPAALALMLLIALGLLAYFRRKGWI